MKAYLINMHLLVLRSRSSAKVKVKYKGYILKKLPFRGYSCFTNTSCFFCKMTLVLLQGAVCGYAALCDSSSVNLTSANIDQSVPNLPTKYMPIRYQISLILGQIKREHTELFALEFGKIAESDILYTLASINIKQSP